MTVRLRLLAFPQCGPVTAPRLWSGMRSPGLPVPAQGAFAHARVYDRAGPGESNEAIDVLRRLKDVT
jgi:hypothetical protein